MNRFATITFVTSALMLNAGISHADDAMKIGVVDMQKAIQTSETGKKAKAELEQAFNKKKKELQAEEASLKKAQEDLQKKASALSESAKKEQGQKLQERFMKYQELLQKSQAEIQKKEQEMSAPIITKIREKIGELAKKKGYTLILEKNENIVLFSQEKDDLTADILKEIN
ncbi:MAG: OmpH family outer membrane protein [Bdellovibrionales bacterium]|nr:OmpH family outer membrane protein [Bdellovibrionales bacterium]